MAPFSDWMLLHKRLREEDANEVVDKMKEQKLHKVSASNVVKCSLCAEYSSHPMRYQTLKCMSKTCAQVGGSLNACPWMGKVLTCLKHHVVDILERREHLVRAADPPSGKLSTKDKAKARALAQVFIKPVRIRNSIADANGGVAPALDKVQNFVAYYRKTKMKNSDDLTILEKMIWDKAFTGGENDTDAFAFTLKTRPDGKLHVGAGTDSDEFFVGYTTKTLLRRMDRNPDTFVFHLDATFKLSQVDYPTFVCGISDKARVFHLVAVFVASQREETQYFTMLASLRCIYQKVMSKALVVRYVMGDADKAQFNGVQEAFGDCEVEYLMCFWHMITKFYQHGKGLPPAKLSLAAADVYDMHFALSESQFHARKTMAVRRWTEDPDVADFGEYFYRQWLAGKFSKWQCFRTPSAFATTNNPVETFNAKIKREYTLRQRMKMGLLLDQLASCCTHESLFGAAFSGKATPTAKIQRRATELRKLELIQEMPALACSGDNAADDYVLVRVQATPRIYVKPRKKTEEIIEICAQMGVNSARMERDDQPDVGWAVNVRDRSCPCKFYFKYAECVHLYYALYVRFGTATPSARPLYNRRQQKRKRALAEEIAEAVANQKAARGRPILNGPALSME